MSVTDVPSGATGSDGADALSAFAAVYVRRLDGGSVEPEAQALLAEVTCAFRLADGRGGAPLAVRAYTPLQAEHGYEPGVSVLETNSADLPFLVDSVSAEIRERGVGIRRVAHPILGVHRDASHRIDAIRHPRDGERESVMHFELDRRLSPTELVALEDGVRAVLEQVAVVVEDFAAMRGRVADMAQLARAAGTRYDADDVVDAVEFLDWLISDHFVILGCRDYAIADGAWGVVAGSGLGLLRDDRSSHYATPMALDQMSPGLRARATTGDLVVISKTNRASPVRRHERMDYIGVRRVDEHGEIVGEARLVGLFATRAYAEAASTIPLVQRKLHRMLEAEDLIEGSHDYKAATRLFDALPKDEVFAAPTDDLRREIVALLALTGDQVRLLGRRGGDGRTASLIAALPRRRYDASLRRRLRALVAKRFGVESVETHEVLGEEERVQYHLTVHSAAADLPDVDVAQLEQELVRLARTWDDDVSDVLVEHHGAERGAMLAARWLGRFGAAYRAATVPLIAAGDLEAFDDLQVSGDDFGVGLQDDGQRTRVALYRRGAKVELSQATRMLEDLGLRVIEELPTCLEAEHELWLQAFGVLGPGDVPLDLAACGARVAAALRATYHGEIESDSLHRLITVSDLDHRQVEVLRAYRRYRQRIGSRYTEGFQNDVLAANAALCAKQMRLFALRFDPAVELDEQAEHELRSEIAADLDAVALLDHDRILRNQLGVIDATVRTTVYHPDRAAIAFKLRAADVPAVPQPAPLWEIFVYAPDLEGVHLRGGTIARGGLRWSERMDYRTEVFGLMRAQMTKNAVIVPAGAKGGFYVRDLPADDPSTARAMVKAGYCRYINALLDLTDDVRDGDVVHPAGVRVRDADDTYLVVAADKGTATFSDTANAIAERRGFWLGDAFASGGSAGYDHKALGITARGAWESVKRHFRGLGVDPANDLFTAVGIGDMSGDVFGNGMLLSDKLRLVGAYDHRHIFIDPEPDAANGFAERRRLFDLVGSSWDDYDRELISPGGGVWPRSAKVIALSDQMRAALGVDDVELVPTELIRAILRAPVDLLWNGGIGTVVKASAESDADALDRSSDAIRVDASELRCRVVGEGGNLGFTQRARNEAARGGVLIHADFIDNSAGVDCSDHEVNLKILLGLAETRGELDRAGRDVLLQDVTDDVCEHVLYDSYQQAQILAQEVQVASQRIYAYEDLMISLGDTAQFDRTLERLPNGNEMAERRRQGKGLLLPELAVLLAHAKLQLTDALLRAPLLDDPALEADLVAYFPPLVVERFGGLLTEHPLRRQLLATIAANHVVNALGPTFVSRLQTERGAAAADVVRAFRIACAVTGAEERWAAIEELDGVIDTTAYWELMTGVDTLVEGVTRWHLSHPGLSISDAAKSGRAGFDALGDVLPALRDDDWAAAAAAVEQSLCEHGVPVELARGHAVQAALVHSPDILAVAQRTDREVADVATVFFALGDALRLEWLEQEVLALPASGRMQRWAASAIDDDVLAVRGELAERALLESPGAAPQAAVDAFLVARAGQLSRLHAFTRALALEGQRDLAGISLAVRQLRALAGS